jgi:transcriptional regulator with XRE-family HTH domain
MAQQSLSGERRRGVVMSSQGWQRLEAAERLSSIRYNQGKAYTLEQLKQITGLSANTLTKLRRRQESVDWQTLKTYFESFGLDLYSDDVLSSKEVNYKNTLKFLQQGPLKGPISFDHPFYICRNDNERLCAEEILIPRALLRIEAPHQFGKTSLIANPLSTARDCGFRISIVNLKGCNQRIFQDTDRFLQWFCATVAKDLAMPHELSQRWESMVGSNYSFWEYFETYLLPAADSPLLLVIDELDELFDYPELATDFLRMLRSWYEHESYSFEQQSIWQRLRLILLYSPANDLLLDYHQSFYNLGLLIPLSPLNWKQVEELTRRYAVEPIEETAKVVFSLVGGHPYLTQLCLFNLNQENMSLTDLSENAIAHDSIFSNHLQQQLIELRKQPSLLEAMKSVAQHPYGMEIDPRNAFQLQGMGLIGFRDQLAIPSCELYRRYFSTKGISWT